MKIFKVESVGFFITIKEKLILMFMCMFYSSAVLAKRVTVSINNKDESSLNPN